MIGLKNYFWFFKGALTKKFCEDVIKHAQNIKEHTGKVKAEEEGFEEKKKARLSTVKWLDDPWIFDEISPYVHTANKNAGWNFEWDWMENIQYTIYKEGQYYGWHTDDMQDAFGEKDHPNYQGKTRKLSVTVNLTDPNDYVGGDLEFDLRNNAIGRNIITMDEARDQGTIVVFPSFVPHQVRPVKKGTRFSLVIWNLGPPWK